MRTLEQMQATAQRQLDGMTVNRDQMAKDVLFLSDTVRRLEALIKTASEKKQREDDAYSSIAKMFGDAFWMGSQQNRHGE